MTDSNKVFKVIRQEPTLIVLPQGDITTFRYNDVHVESNRVLRLLDEDALNNVIIDFGNADYVSSVVIGALIRFARKATDHGGQAVICSVTGNMTEILTTMNLLKLWPSFPTREAALDSLES